MQHVLRLCYVLTLCSRTQQEKKKLVKAENKAKRQNKSRSKKDKKRKHTLAKRQSH